MTDRERLLEQVREAEGRAAKLGAAAAYYATKWPPMPDRWSYDISPTRSYEEARNAAHHALTAMALQDAIEKVDSVDAVRSARVPVSCFSGEEYRCR